ncbi:hypothetical protein KC333_g129 [Hortaea werneckii]|nr:hypothetical protein KC333_g129 [Hortaea werneckii]
MDEEKRGTMSKSWRARLMTQHGKDRSIEFPRSHDTYSEDFNDREIKLINIADLLSPSIVRSLRHFLPPLKLHLPIAFFLFLSLVD